MKAAIVTLILLASLAFEALASPRPRRARAAQVWRGFSHPAYLPRVPRRPNQHVLDSLARAATGRNSLTTNRPR